ncbi:MAG TPA: RdgB/HAM1 family non-canonical purine NTP pyrophosphatase [Pyrinomonadaceae bacterium]|nr:RdgB/HAM1 family non-canonical purine NTP pyrophosphatase [Pyrinomonadaceae bacterium]
MPKLLIATRNAGKIAEISARLAGNGLSAVGLWEVNCSLEVEETGATFEENAVLKAREYAKVTGLPTLADDSGLEVSALGGRPGVHSARYGGETGYGEKMQMLLDELTGIEESGRGARFVCVMALAHPDGRHGPVSFGECRGVIADAPRGEGGFGYDPIFIPDGFDRTFGELSAEVKARISHRARALETIIRELPDFIGI